METPKDAQISSMLQQAIAAAERSNLRDGYIPKDHPHPQVVIDKFMHQRSRNQQTFSGDNLHMFTTSQVPPSYAPSICPTDDLIPMTLSQMQLQTHHQGRKVLLRVITPQDTMNAIMAVVEDEEGTAVLLQLYHQFQPTAADPEDMLRPNIVLIVKEPFFKIAVDGAHSIRVDHVSDVIWLQATDPGIPSKWMDERPKVEASVVIREQGNVAVKNKHWAKAEKLYSHAVRAAKTPEEEQLAYLNRSLANLRLYRPERALEDASNAAKIGGQNEKALFREARALYELGRFAESSEKLRIVTELYPQNDDARIEFQRVQKRIKEAQTGEYDFASMYQQAKATPPNIDCATYSDAVTIRETDRRGSGLFTTKPVKAGDLILCEKAFAYCYADKDDPIGRKNMSLLLPLDAKAGSSGGQGQLLTQIVQKLYYSPRTSEGFRSLHHGDYTPVTVSEVDGYPVVDTLFVDRVINSNCFGSRRTSDGKLLFAGKLTDDHVYTTRGVWLLASRINHMCLGNCRRSFIGDMIIVRACRDLAAGIELRFAYQPAFPRTTYEETQKALKEWGFVCDCPWCLDRKSATKKALSTRKTLLLDIEAVQKEITGSRMVNHIQLIKLPRLLNEADKTYPKRQGAVRLELWDAYFTLGYMFVSLHRPKDGAEAIIKGLKALGYDIIACSTQGGTQTFEIQHWGFIQHESVRAFLKLHEAYKVIAPELCPKFKKYAKIVYTMCIGSDVTVGTVFPELA